MFLLAALPHLSAQPPQSANDRLNPLRAEWTLPSSYTLQPSTEPSLIVNALSMPVGRLIANAWACESPTITTRAGPAGCTTGVALTTVVAVDVGVTTAPAAGVEPADGCRRMPRRGSAADACTLDEIDRHIGPAGGAIELIDA